MGRFWGEAEGGEGSEVKGGAVRVDGGRGSNGEGAGENLKSNGKLIDGGMVYRETFVIRCYEVGVNRVASIESIANLLQEIACNHAQSVGFSNDGFATTPSMRRRRLIWVTTRLHVEMNRYPIWGDRVEIDTWFQGEGNVMSRRDWIIKIAETKEVIGRATSSWVNMNQDTRRLSKVHDDVKAEFILHCPSPPRFALPDVPAVKIPKLEDPAESVWSYLRPRRGDLDMNNHVNSVTYVGWMLESIPGAVLEVAELAKITLEYRREVSGGEMVESLATMAPPPPLPLPLPLPLSEAKAAATRGPPPAESNGNGNGSAAGSVATAASPKFMVKSGGELEFIHLLRLQDDNKEINRGRTAWRAKSTCRINP